MLTCQPTQRKLLHHLMTYRVLPLHTLKRNKLEKSQIYLFHQPNQTLSRTITVNPLLYQLRLLPFLFSACTKLSQMEIVWVAVCGYWLRFWTKIIYTSTHDSFDTQTMNPICLLNRYMCSVCMCIPLNLYFVIFGLIKK